MSDLTGPVKGGIDAAAKVAKKVTDKAAGKAKNAAHALGKKMIQGGKTLKSV